VWFDAHFDASFAPSCLFGCAIVAWAITALGALLFTAQRHGDAVDAQDVLAIGFVACVLIVVLHLTPDIVGLTLAAVMALHAVLIATIVALDYLHAPAPQPPAPVR
jgi:hypothetical protein